MRHFLSLGDLTTIEIDRLFSITEDLKSKYERGLREPLLPGRVMALLFEKPSLRTRVSFEAGMSHLGGSAIMLGDDSGFGKRESLSDFTRVLSQYVDVLVVRFKSHQSAAELAQHATCPVINGLTELEHPCQALADLYTVREHFGSFDGARLAFVGDANNVARSLALGCGSLGIEMVLATPEGYEFDKAFRDRHAELYPKSKLTATHDPKEAIEGATVIYTDVWASMGQEAEREERKKMFAPFQVNADLMSRAAKGAIFMHCLPARRGEEVTDEVIDGVQSVVVAQAANRMHVQKGVLTWLIGTQPK